MKKLKLNLEGAKALNKNEQKLINGGGDCYNLGNACSNHTQCGSMYCDLICDPNMNICIPA